MLVTLSSLLYDTLQAWPFSYTSTRHLSMGGQDTAPCHWQSNCITLPLHCVTAADVITQYLPASSHTEEIQRKFIILFGLFRFKNKMMEQLYVIQHWLYKDNTIILVLLFIIKFTFSIHLITKILKHLSFD